MVAPVALVHIRVALVAAVHVHSLLSCKRIKKIILAIT
jgi:hypothetical protein